MFSISISYIITILMYIHKTVLGTEVLILFKWEKTESFLH